VFTDIDQAKAWLMEKAPLNKVGYVLAVTGTTQRRRDRENIIK